MDARSLLSESGDLLEVAANIGRHEAARGRGEAVDGALSGGNVVSGLARGDVRGSTEL